MVSMDTSLEDWARYTPRERLQRYAIFLFAVITIVWALTSIDVIWPWVFDAPQQMGDLFSRMVPPDVTNLPSILWVLVETVNIATIATAIAVFVSLPVAYIAAQNTTPNAATLWLGRFILVSSRSVNTIIWALLFVAIFGPGIVAGIIAIMFRSIGFIGKLLGEAIEEIDRRPVEALEATGASRFKVILYAIVPQVMPTFWAVAILRWDINLRESTVLGLVGAGGIGIILQSAIDTFNWQEAATVLLAILALVVLGEIVSAWLRKRII
ncbi:phosphonate ABC transporter, permease protein PhnE (plasmid) [Nitratireductor rhodophyticola]|uniref:phosphonate ABC transporter, permease protein PhnE n=1 Tax=Nitratireductor rhodophyticola TaxID=2854036 RepID=UPI00081416E8|nr:phosphonate ABC transporter, permease protein PhnE [Nitratireductor rhodophyticola]MEC9244582.1 phosphonate ABC transporter, permease protein PhnE [Pseudomonadota bacterium]WPZ16646.1 phosphonate ABC transporter, permease protein PhnE [Nitratireductor rhodophyticola]